MIAPQTVADVLNAAADLIEPEGAWIQGYYALDANGDSVTARDIDAMCWCVLGAIRVAGHFDHDTTRPSLVFNRHIGAELMDKWNDAPERTQVEVVAALRAAAIAAIAAIPAQVCA